MIAEFERNQLDGKNKLSAEERSEAQRDLLNTITEEFLVHLMKELKITPEMEDVTDSDFYESGLQKIKDACRKVLIERLTVGCLYDHTKTYDCNMEEFSNSVLEQIKLCLLESSRYVANRILAPSDTIMHTAIVEAAKQWFLTPEECKELKEQGYWKYY